MADPVGDFKEMGVWRVAMYITRLIYEETRKLPDDERFGLTSQMRRTAVSIASNIAEAMGAAVARTTSGSCRSPAAPPVS